MRKTSEAFRTISEVANELGVPKHVLRFWESKFPQIKPMKRGGGRRYYRPEDLALLRGIRKLLHADRYTIKGVQKILREQGVEAVKASCGGANGQAKPAKVSAKANSNRTASSGTAMHPSPTSAAARQQRNAEIDRLIGELEACRSLIIGKPSKAPAARRPRAARKSRSA